MLAYALSEPANARYEGVSSDDRAWIFDATNTAVRLAPRSDFVFATRADMRTKILGRSEMKEYTSNTTMAKQEQFFAYGPEE